MRAQFVASFVHTQTPRTRATLDGSCVHKQAHERTHSGASVVDSYEKRRKCLAKSVFELLYGPSLAHMTRTPPPYRQTRKHMGLDTL